MVKGDIMVKIRALKNKDKKETQLIITFPKSIASAMRLKAGDELEFLFDKGDVIVRKV